MKTHGSQNVIFSYEGNESIGPNWYILIRIRSLYNDRNQMFQRYVSGPVARTFWTTKYVTTFLIRIPKSVHFLVMQLECTRSPTFTDLQLILIRPSIDEVYKRMNMILDRVNLSLT